MQYPQKIFQKRKNLQNIRQDRIYPWRSRADIEDTQEKDMLSEDVPEEDILSNNIQGEIIPAEY